MHNLTFGPTAPTLHQLMGIRHADLGGTGEGAGGAGGEGQKQTAAQTGTIGLDGKITPTGQTEGGATSTEGGEGKPQQGETQEQIVARLTAEVARLSREKEDARVAKEGTIKAEAKRTELLALAKVMGVEGVEDGMTTEQLTEKITGKTLVSDTQAEQTNAALRQATVDRDVVTEAWKQAIPADKAGYLNFQLTQQEGYKALDPSAADYSTKRAAMVKSVVEGDPAIFKGQDGSGSSGGGNHGGSGGGQELSQEAFDAMNITEKTDLFNKNRPLFDRLVAGTN